MSEIKDSGKRREFDTGAVRDIQEGKGRCDLLPLQEISDLAGFAATDENIGYRDEIMLERFSDIMQEINDFIKDSIPAHLFRAVLVFIDNCADSDIFVAILEVAKHFEDGAIKYGDRNWEKGIPLHCYIDSGIRHLIKYCYGADDERHDRAFVWNMLCAAWTIRNKPNLDDITMKAMQRKED